LAIGVLRGLLVGVKHEVKNFRAVANKHFNCLASNDVLNLFNSLNGVSKSS